MAAGGTDNKPNPQQRIREHLDMLARHKAARKQAALLAKQHADGVDERERGFNIFFSGANRALADREQKPRPLRVPGALPVPLRLQKPRETDIVRAAAVTPNEDAARRAPSKRPVPAQLAEPAPVAAVPRSQRRKWVVGQPVSLLTADGENVLTGVHQRARTPAPDAAEYVATAVIDVPPPCPTAETVPASSLPRVPSASSSCRSSPVMGRGAPLPDASSPTTPTLPPLAHFGAAAPSSTGDTSPPNGFAVVARLAAGPFVRPHCWEHAGFERGSGVGSVNGEPRAAPP